LTSLWRQRCQLGKISLRRKKAIIPETLGRIYGMIARSPKMCPNMATLELWWATVSTKLNKESLRVLREEGAIQKVKLRLGFQNLASIQCAR
jgi:hypothetical protein